MYGQAAVTSHRPPAPDRLPSPGDLPQPPELLQDGPLARAVPDVNGQVYPSGVPVLPFGDNRLKSLTWRPETGVSLMASARAEETAPEIP